MAWLLNRKHLSIKIIEFVFILCVTVLSSVSGQLTPQNTAVDVGANQTYLNCSNPAATTNQFVWSFTNYSSGATSNVATGCNPFNKELYEVDSSKANTCNLIIVKAQSLHAGLYTCSPGGQTASSAQLIVMTTPAKCGSEGTDGHTFRCGATFSGNISPNVTWYNSSVEDSNRIIPTTPYSDATAVGSLYQVSSSLATAPPNLCKINFTAPSIVPTGQASNAPNYASTCSVKAFTPGSSATRTDYSLIPLMIIFGTMCVLQKSTLF